MDAFFSSERHYDGLAIKVGSSYYRFSGWGGSRAQQENKYYYYEEREKRFEEYYPGPRMDKSELNLCTNETVDFRFISDGENEYTGYQILWEQVDSCEECDQGKYRGDGNCKDKVCSCPGPATCGCPKEHYTSIIDNAYLSLSETANLQVLDDAISDHSPILVNLDTNLENCRSKMKTIFSQSHHICM